MNARKKPPDWSHTATAMTRVAFRELERTKAHIEALKRRAAFLEKRLVSEGGGQLPDGRRLAIRHQNASVRQVTYTKRTKARYYVAILKAT